MVHNRKMIVQLLRKGHKVHSLMKQVHTMADIVTRPDIAPERDRDNRITAPVYNSEVSKEAFLL